LNLSNILGDYILEHLVEFESLGCVVYRFKPTSIRLDQSMVTLRFTAILEPAEEGGFVIKCLELPVATQAETREEALENIREAIEGYLEVKAERLGKQMKGERVQVVVEAPSALVA